jgi:hypothetical protein
VPLVVGGGLIMVVVNGWISIEKRDQDNHIFFGFSFGFCLGIWVPSSEGNQITINIKDYRYSQIKGD